MSEKANFSEIRTLKSTQGEKKINKKGRWPSDKIRLAKLTLKLTQKNTKYVTRFSTDTW
jgi:hypothetical protein